MIKNYSKKTPQQQACWLQTGQASFSGLFDCSQLRGPSPALLHSPPASSPALQQLLDPQVQALTLLLATQQCTRGIQWFVLLWCIPLWECRVARWKGDWSCCCRGIPQSAPWGSLSFWENPPAQSCQSIQGRACPLTQPTSPARLGTVQVKAPHGPTLNFPQPAPMIYGLCVFTTLRPYSPPCDFKQPGLSPCCSSLVWQGRELLTWLYQESYGRPGCGPGAAVALVPELVPGTFLSWSNPLTVCCF